MSEKENADSRPSQAADLRQEAERRLHNKNAPPVEGMAEVDVRALLHELQVHQIELEMQNEELLSAPTAVQEVSDKYHDLFDFAPIGYFRMDEQGRILEVNLAGAALLGLDRSTAVKQRFAQHVAIQSRARFAEFLGDVLRADGKQTHEIELQCGEQRRYALLEGMLSQGGEVNRSFHVTATDITERKRLEEADRLLASIVELSEDAIIAKTLSGSILTWNAAAERMYGYAAEEVVGRPISILIPPEQADELPWILARIARGERIAPYETVRLRKDGTRIHVSLAISPLTEATGRILGAATIARDVTERKRAEQTIKDHEEELVTIYENAPIIMLLVDAERRVRKVNKYAKQFAGASEAELIGRRGGEALRCVHAPDDPRGCGFGQRCQHCPVRRTVLETLGDGRSRHQVEASLPFAVDGKAQNVTFLLSTARLNVRGQPQVLVAIQDITDRKELEKAMATLASFPTLNPSPVVEVDLAGQVHFVNPAARLLFPDLQQRGGAHPWLAEWDSVARAFRKDSAQEIVREVTVGEDCYQQMMHYVEDIERVRIYAMDVTARKRADEALQETTAELARSNKDLDHFASVASHDLQEPLRTVSGFVQLLQKKYVHQLDAEADQFIEFAVDGTKRMQTLIRDLLAYARVGSRGLELAPTDAGASLRQAVDNLRVRIEETAAEITYGELPTVRVDAGQLVQLFQNLLGNALKFHGELPPKIHVDASRQEDHWLFSVRDNGIGIAAESLDRIFMIFERLHTRAQYPGTGIGLAICKRIVDRHGGRISVESEPGQGTTFRFTLP